MRLLLLLSTMLMLSVSAQAEPPMSAGHYQMILGDCVACHGTDLAGGMAFPTPVGDIYATNITPDSTYGIGDYSLEDFIQAMRQGVTKSGDNLYPAMPYTSYAKMNDADLEALYTYFMEEVEPLAIANKEADIPWPLSMRWPLSVWKWMFHDDSRYSPDHSKSDEWNRGAYLVQGAAHCGTCHTPRGWAMQEKGLSHDSDDYLTGAELNAWYAMDIRGEHIKKDELIDLLQTGRSDDQAVLGPMAEVITHSSQYFTDADLNSIATYLTSLSATQSNAGSGQAMAAVSEQSQIQYATFCGACHGREGEGTERVIPALAGNNTVLADNPASLINIILSGGSTANTQTHIGYSMPGYSWLLDDQQVAAMANFLRASWGNQARAVTAKEVAKQR